MPDLVIERLLVDHAGEFELRPAEGINLAGEETGRKTLSHSSLNLWLACNQKFGWSKIERLEPVSRRHALSLGSAFHYGIEVAPTPDDAMQEAINFLFENAAPPSDQAEADKLMADAAIVGAAAKAYLRKWPAPANEKREVEYVVRIRNPWTGAYSRTFDLRGYADGLIDQGDHYELVERKLVGQINEVSRKKLYLDRQISLACYAVWRATGKPVKVVRYRYTRKPSIRLRKGEQVEEFVNRIEEEYETRPEFYTPDFDPAYRDARDLLRAEAELWKWAKEIREGVASGFFPRNTGHCSDFGGCEFLPLCMGDPAAPSLFREREQPTTTSEEGSE